jgi:hypothetical protein
MIATLSFSSILGRNSHCALSAKSPANASAIPFTSVLSSGRRIVLDKAHQSRLLMITDKNPKNDFPFLEDTIHNSGSLIIWNVVFQYSLRKTFSRKECFKLVLGNERMSIYRLMTQVPDFNS